MECSHYMRDYDLAEEKIPIRFQPFYPSLPVDVMFLHSLWLIIYI